MRIIGGSLRGRKLFSPEGRDTRPTSDRLRESLFNILNHKLEAGFEGLTVADIFAGTGALGIEAISRGAKSTTFVEKHAGRNSPLFKNIEALNLKKETKILEIDARQLPTPQKKIDLIFMDPPYSEGLVDLTLKSILKNNWCNEGCLVVAESHLKDEIIVPNEFKEIDVRKYGKSKINILKFQSTSTK